MQQMRNLTLPVIFFALAMQLCLGQVPVNSAKLSSPRKAISSVAVGDRAMFVGGYDFHDSVPSDRIDVFDAINQTWTNSLSLPKARGYVSAVAVESEIYFLGGITRTNSPYLYVPSTRTFLPMGSGPTVRTPKQISVLGSDLTVVGSFSVDFLDLDTGNWTYNANLTKLIMSRKDSLVFAYQQLVFVIGGVDLATNEIFLDAWIFNTQTNELTEYPAISTYNTTGDNPWGPFTFAGSENVVVVRLADRCLLYHLVRDIWFEQNTAYNITHSVTAYDVTFMFGNNFVFYDWNQFNSGDSEDVNIRFGSAINGTVFYIIDGEVVIVGGPRWLQTGLQFSGPIRFGQPWTDTQYVFVDDTALYVLDVAAASLFEIVSFSRIISMFVSDDRTLHIFDDTDTLTLRSAPPGNLPAFGPPITFDFAFSRPVALVDGDFISLFDGVAVAVTDASTLYLMTSFRDATLFAQDGSTFVVMYQYLTPAGHEQYKYMDIYDTLNDTWTTVDMPHELFLDPLEENYQETFMSAAVVNNNIMAWVPGAFAVYDTDRGEWTPYISSLTEYGTTPVKRVRSMAELYYEVPVIDGVAYVHSDGLPYLYQFAPDLLNFTFIEPAPVTGLIIQQPIANKEKLYVSMKATNINNFEALYIYDTTLQNWQTTLLPAKVPNVAISASEEYIIVVGSNKLQILSVALGQWNEQNIEFDATPSAIIHVGNFTLVAGGELPSGELPSGRYSDSVLIISDDLIFIEQPVAVPSEPVVTSPAPDASGLTIGQLVTAIVVPIVVVLGAGLALLLILLKRHKKSKRSTTTVGLEQQFGQWFTPFNDIQFGPQLGQGGNGQVFKGKWKNTDVALKVSMTQANQSVIDELSLMINLRPHPNVVQLYGFSVHPETNSIILILEFCNGGALDDYLRSQSTSTATAQKVRMLQGVARGVVHLHANNIVHRDLAARNVLLHQGEPKITDFGMSRVVDEQQQRGTTKSELGPIRWMAPESLKSKQYSTKSDVWSFGIVMYEVMEQQEPHLNADPITIGRQIRDEGLTPQIDASSSCPSTVSSLMKRCWDLAPEKRPTMDVVLHALEQIN